MFSTKFALIFQLRDLNEESSKDVQWTLDGKRVIPQSLNVAKLTLKSFEKTMTFTRISKKHLEAPFKRRYVKINIIICYQM